MQFKDEALNRIAEQGGNIAQFVSFAPNGTQRFARIRGVSHSQRFTNVEEAVSTILQTGPTHVSIRSFLPERPDGNPHFMGSKGFETPMKVSAKVQELMAQGFYIMITEEVDVYDGGVYGVMLGNIVEFATRDTPRCVEKSGCAALPRFVMPDFVQTVYGHSFNIPYDRSYRVEFSVHPSRIGYGNQHQIIWQIEQTEHGGEVPEPKPYWPNRVSMDMGDKAYGLLMAHLYGFRVPHTRIVGRFIPPFEFGDKTGSPETCWRRTCPTVQQPGRFTTKHGQVDPFALMQAEDPERTQIAALMFQDNVEAVYSGATITDATGNTIIEGKAGHGDDFMIGVVAPDANLPVYIKDGIRSIWEKAYNVFGAVRFEWCCDKSGTVWIVQFHVGQSASAGNIIYPGKSKRFEICEVTQGLEVLRSLIERAKQEKFGIILKGNIGITSHFGDILRRARIPSRLERT